MDTKSLQKFKERRTKQFHLYLKKDCHYDDATIDFMQKKLPDIYKATYAEWERETLNT